MSWRGALDQPGRDFFETFAAQLETASPADLVSEAVCHLVPRLGWAEYLPHVPLGVLGLRAVLRLEPLLSRSSFLRALATQLWMVAKEGRGTTLLEPTAEGPLPPRAFEDLQAALWPDMATLGFKAVFAGQWGDLARRLGGPTDRTLFAVAAWLGAAEPRDLFWHRFAERKLEQSIAMESSTDLVDIICIAGLPDLMGRLASDIQAGLEPWALLPALVRAAASKQVDARRDLEGKTTWLWVYLSALALARPQAPHPWMQAAALVNLYPSDDPEERWTASPRTGDGPGLLDAILDGEPKEAFPRALGLEAAALLPILAEAASRNDPSFNHGRQILAVAAAADLMPHLDEGSAHAMLASLAKSLANSQGSSDLGRFADRALAKVRG